MFYIKDHDLNRGLLFDFVIKNNAIPCIIYDWLTLENSLFLTKNIPPSFLIIQVHRLLNIFCYELPFAF